MHENITRLNNTTVIFFHSLRMFSIEICAHFNSIIFNVLLFDFILIAGYYVYL